VCCYFAPINAALPHVGGGKVLALAVSSAQRSPLLPNVPTIAESGVPGFDYTLWIGLWGPAAMPAELVGKINADVRKALNSPDLKGRLTKLGTLPMDMSSQQFTTFVRKELDDTAKVMQAAGIKPQ
jgi:tripartite-type tricarboxylate transporter receptor subunit TctC